MDKIRVMQVGIGPIGQKVVRYMEERQAIDIVAAVDVDPDKIGKDLGQVCDLGKDLGVAVSGDLAAAVANARPDVAVLTTVSSFEKCAVHAAEIAKLGVHVVSTCEEMSYPWETSPEVARKLDDTAKANNVAVLGTGVNPGFLMDFLPTALTAVCQVAWALRPALAYP